MTEAECRARIVLFADGETEPALQSPDLDVLVTMCRTVDKFGLVFGDDNWTETYNYYYGVAQAWLLKAGRLANRYLFMTGGQMLSRQQYYDHCMKMYHKYAMKSGIRAQRLGPALDPIYDAVPNNWNP